MLNVIRKLLDSFKTKIVYILNVTKINSYIKYVCYNENIGIYLANLLRNGDNTAIICLTLRTSTFVGLVSRIYQVVQRIHKRC